ncbi:MAG: suppressor of fused domain protein [Myxococcales bacterium]|nr:suppressor of fused domain protein [Myxococcales bacterium]
MSDGHHHSEDEVEDEVELLAPGWAAIDQRVLSCYPGQVPHQFASRTAYELESQSPLPAISVVEGAQPEHWHYLTYGLSELFEKTSNDPAISGFGFELTMRTPRGAGEERPPAWPLRFLQALGRHILSTREGFDTGHRIDLGGPIVYGGESALTGVAIVPDPTLGKIETPFGSLLFLQLVGVTAAELAAMKKLDYEKVVEMLAELAPRGITDPARACWTKDPQKSPVVKRYELGIGF